MNALIQLIVCHALAGAGGFFAAHHIDGSTTTGILVGLIMMLLGTSISSVCKWWKLEPAQITDNILLRQFIGALVSQGITALSAYFATDANDPQLLAVAAVNMTASKFGAHQKLALLGNKAQLLLLFALCPSLFALSSCSHFTKQEAITAMKRVGLAAADESINVLEARLKLAQADLNLALEDHASGNDLVIKQLAVIAAQEALDQGRKAVAKQRAKLDAKQPRDVTPGGQTSASAEVGKAGALPSHDVPACLLRGAYQEHIAIPFYGTLIAEQLAAQR
ncbi:hypothetical protein [Prosthecobacter sp.]|uniref:hypothetical protein n=1 Tax=Prosthecobacter sp. TaxID=1965333 RepID=UPI001DF6DCA7|nr:hypothetical protein [Prosthecobacter sp.]MCB1279878.1 hypothetical protein [Prosthecobacter sp.]